MSRRRFLQGLGLTVAAAPFVPLLNASGQEQRFPQRLLLLFSPGGTPPVVWKPSGLEPLRLPDIFRALEPFSDRLIVPHGLVMSAPDSAPDMDEHDLGMGALWTGSGLELAPELPSADAGALVAAGGPSPTPTPPIVATTAGPSIDRIVAADFGAARPYGVAPDAAQQETPFRTLDLGVGVGQQTPASRMLFDVAGNPIEPRTNVVDTFQTLFGGLVDLQPERAEPRPSELASLRLLAKQLEAVRTQVGSSDYDKIEAHLDALRELEVDVTRAAAERTTGCFPPATPDAATSGFPEDADWMMQMLVHAFACDLTRVASLQLSTGRSALSPSWLGLNQTQEELSHDDSDEARQQLASVHRWYTEQVASLLTRLDNIAEGDGTVLDNTLVVWGSEVANSDHARQPLPLVLAGGAGGRLQFGRGLLTPGQPHASALVSICNALGVDLDTVGDVDPNTGGLAGL